MLCNSLDQLTCPAKRDGNSAVECLLAMKMPPQTTCAILDQRKDWTADDPAFDEIVTVHPS